MYRNQERVPASGMILVIVLLINDVIVEHAYTSNGRWYPLLLITVPFLLIAFYNLRRRK